MGPTLTIDPDPPTQGQQALVCYTGGSPPVELHFEYIDADPVDVWTDGDGCVEITIPSTATAVKITGGEAEALASQIQTG